MFGMRAKLGWPCGEVKRSVGLTAYLAAANVLTSLMKRNVATRLNLMAAACVLAVASVACDDTGLIPASFPNMIDTVTLFALRGTPIPAQSAFDIAFGIAARTDEGDAFDFAFDIDSVNAAVIMPAGALGLTAQAGLQISDKTFEEVDEAPFDDYVVDSALVITEGDVFIGRSRNTAGNCFYLGSLPRYGKFRVLEIDRPNRTLTLEFLVNSNCGYRKLEPGFPTS
jgi:hypothetical protein